MKNIWKLKALILMLFLAINVQANDDRKLKNTPDGSKAKLKTPSTIIANDKYLGLGKKLIQVGKKGHERKCSYRCFVRRVKESEHVGKDIKISAFKLKSSQQKDASKYIFSMDGGLELVLEDYVKKDRLCKLKHRSIKEFKEICGFESLDLANEVALSDIVGEDQEAQPHCVSSINQDQGTKPMTSDQAIQFLTDFSNSTQQ